MMKNNLIKRLLTLCMAILLPATMLTACGKNKGEPEPATVLTDCTVTVLTEGGIALENVGVSIYADKEQQELIDFVRTNADGVISTKGGFSSGNAYVFLTDVPDGYASEEYYVITEKETVITLKTAFGTEMSEIVLGGVMFDFTVTDQNGTGHTLTNLLENKKAVVLNLWYTSCVPCKMEFPYLQQAYNEYKDDVALIALNPIDDADAVAAFATENGLTFPMAACDPNWANQIAGIAYPTTVVVDRFGSIALIHTGSIDNSATFKNLFAHFSADDYKQATFADISTFAAAEDDPVGTAANPYVHSGNGNFSVEAEPAQTVYYTLYGADGLKISVDGSSLKLLCDEKEYTPNEGNISFTIRATDATAPVLMQFTNTDSSKATYKVTLTSPEGSSSNPITLKDGTVTVKLEEDNNRGVYYLYKSSGEGTFTLECKNTVSYTVTIQNLNGKETATLDKNNKTASIDVRKNDEVQIVVIAVPKDGKYPTTEAKLNASFKKEEIPVTPSTGDSTDDSTLNTNGTLINPNDPIEYGGVLSFNADVKAGEIVLYHVYRVSGTTLRIADATAYVIYGDKTYTPDKNGYVYVPVTSDSPNNPIVLKIGNGGKENKTYAVKFSFPEGSMMNPYDAVAGSITANIAAGNEQGVYYQTTAEKDGKITIELKSITSGVACDIRIDVTNENDITQQHLLSETSDGKSLTVDIEQGNRITINIVALPDEDYKYPAATVKFALSFS